MRELSIHHGDHTDRLMSFVNLPGWALQSSVSEVIHQVYSCHWDITAIRADKDLIRTTPLIYSVPVVLILIGGYVLTLGDSIMSISLLSGLSGYRQSVLSGCHTDMEKTWINYTRTSRSACRSPDYTLHRNQAAADTRGRAGPPQPW